ncbi:universal stress protein [Streptomyces sp. NPDC002132]|uniref:universal stress protein n=1 Tax=unclassified Streptomyces TaxID=2593676 RepID=UPI003325AEC9
MSRTVTVGLDDSPESRTAAEWAAREALLRGLPLKIVHVQWPTPLYAALLGLDVDQPDDTLLEFAFDAAARRKAALRAVHAWPEPHTPFLRFPGDAERHDTLERGQASLLSKVLHPWRQEFRDVEVIEASRCGSAPQVLANDSRDASLVVVGRRIRTGFSSAHVGHVTHSALHHITAPVAVVAHS